MKQSRSSRRQSVTTPRILDEILAAVRANQPVTGTELRRALLLMEANQKEGWLRYEAERNRHGRIRDEFLKLETRMRTHSDLTSELESAARDRGDRLSCGVSNVVWKRAANLLARWIDRQFDPVPMCMNGAEPQGELAKGA